MKISRIPNSIFNSNTYILSGGSTHDYWLVDIGDIEPVLKKIPANNKIKGVFLTHTHYDHIYGINKLISHYPDCTVYTSINGKEALYSEKMNFSRYHGDPIIFSGFNIFILHEGDKIQLFDTIYLNAIETPGHDKSCLSYYTESEIFTGDSYIPGLKVIASFPNSNKSDVESSKQKIIKLAENLDIYPGHGEIYKKFSSKNSI